MNIYTMSTTCSICGGPGVCTVRTAAAEWTGGRIVHNDPEVCRYYLDKERKEIEKQKKS